MNRPTQTAIKVSQTNGSRNGAVGVVFCIMSAKQFQHFMQFHQQIAGLRRAKRAGKAGPHRISNPAVTAAKEWLAGAVRQRSYSASL